MDFKIARSNMVENQIRANKVTNLSVINASMKNGLLTIAIPVAKESLPKVVTIK